MRDSNTNCVKLQAQICVYQKSSEPLLANITITCSERVRHHTSDRIKLDTKVLNCWQWPLKALLLLNEAFSVNQRQAYRPSHKLLDLGALNPIYDGSNAFPAMIWVFTKVNLLECRHVYLLTQCKYECMSALAFLLPPVTCIVVLNCVSFMKSQHLLRGLSS